MKFRDFAESLLGSRVKIKLLKYILSEEVISSEREIAKLLGLSHTAVSKTLKEFHESNLISPIRVGNVLVWQLNKDSYAYLLLTHFPDYIKKEPLSDLIVAIGSGLNYFSYVKKVVIFGSIAEGKELPNSDIDLFVLVEKEVDRKNAMLPLSNLNNITLNKYGNKLSPNIFTYKDLKIPRNKKFLENVDKGIVIIEK